MSGHYRFHNPIFVARLAPREVHGAYDGISAATHGAAGLATPGWPWGPWRQQRHRSVHRLPARNRRDGPGWASGRRAGSRSWPGPRSPEHRPSSISGYCGVSPGTAVTGFPPGHVFKVHGTIHRADGGADITPKSDPTRGPPRTTIGDRRRSPTAKVLPSSARARRSAPACTRHPPRWKLGGSLTLDAHGDPTRCFIFQAPRPSSPTRPASVTLTGDAEACNVFWQVGSPATLGTSSDFAGSVLALTSISVDTGDTIAGRALARNGAVTLDDDTITVPSCARSVPPRRPHSDGDTDGDRHGPDTDGDRHGAPPRRRPGPTPTATATSPTATPTATGPTPTPTATSRSPPPVGPTLPVTG